MKPDMNKWWEAIKKWWCQRIGHRWKNDSLKDGLRCRRCGEFISTKEIVQKAELLKSIRESRTLLEAVNDEIVRATAGADKNAPGGVYMRAWMNQTREVERAAEMTKAEARS